MQFSPKIFLLILSLITFTLAIDTCVEFLYDDMPTVRWKDAGTLWGSYVDKRNPEKRDYYYLITASTPFKRGENITITATLKDKKGLGQQFMVMFIDQSNYILKIYTIWANKECTVRATFDSSELGDIRRLDRYSKYSGL